MDKEQIVEYCRRLVKANLRQYDSNLMCVKEIVLLDDDEILLGHLNGLKELIEEAIKIIKKGEKDGHKDNK